MVDVAKQLRGFVYASCYGCSIKEGRLTHRKQECGGRGVLIGRHLEPELYRDGAGPMIERKPKEAMRQGQCLVY